MMEIIREIIKLCAGCRFKGDMRISMVSLHDLSLPFGFLKYWIVYTLYHSSLFVPETVYIKRALHNRG
jgi:hypothetical protein